MSLYLKYVIFIVLFYGVVQANGNVDKSDNTLYLVHVIFRHGERTPQRSYPKDIYTKEKYDPYGYGGLRNEGKHRMHNLGLSLKKRYREYLSNTHNQSEVTARSSPLPRTQMSCEIVMAALFNPTEEGKWNSNTNLQPITCDYVPSKGNLMFLADRNCPQIKVLKGQAIENDRRNGKFDQYKNLFNYLSNHTGWKIQSPPNITKVFDILRCQNEMNLQLPEWTQSVFPSPLNNLSLADWDYIGKSDDLKRYNGGVLFKNIVEDTIRKINKTENYEDKKLFIYCAHDTNIIAILGILGIYERKIMPYGATIIIEVHRINEEFLIKVLYQKDEVWNPKLMTLPNCQRECTLEDFEKAYHNYYGSNDMC